jgi:hypothetical protein
MDSHDNCTLWVLKKTAEAANIKNKDNPAYVPVYPEKWPLNILKEVLNNPDQKDTDKDKVGDQCDFDFTKKNTAGSYAKNECYVILDDRINCLKIKDPQLQVYSVAVVAAKTYDDPVRLRLFANRINERLKYTWKLEQGNPDGIKITNTTGEVNCSTPYEYHYKVKIIKDQNGNSITEDLSATFKTRLSGSYTLKLEVQALDKTGNPKPGALNRAQAFVVINSSGQDDYNPSGCGCNTIGKTETLSIYFWAFMLMFIFIVRKRLVR